MIKIKQMKHDVNLKYKSFILAYLCYDDFPKKCDPSILNCK